MKKRQLLTQFGSVEKIKNASIDDLKKIKGLNDEIIKRLKEL